MHEDPSALGRYKAAQAVHTELLPFVHVSGLTQLAIGVHAAQTSGLPSTRYVPLVHDVHCEVVALVQVRVDVHPLTGVQAAHTSAAFGPPSTR